MKSKLTYLLILLFQFFVLSGCLSDHPEVDHSEQKQEMQADAGISDKDAVEGIVRVKLNASIGDDFNVALQGTRVASSSTEFNDFLNRLNATDMKRVFPPCGKFEERTRKEGLHLWYEITFDKSIPVTRASTDATSIPGVDIVEKVPRIAPPNAKIQYTTKVGTRAGADSPFNDPQLEKQWHYNNTGKYPKSIAGADINLFEAWKTETGKPSVIVAVVDGGIDYRHEDLKDNMYVNLKELNGTPGEDSDGNGFIDDIYGYNFVNDKGEIISNDHGTHVAGTIGARNNNGIGVCGIAGGDGSPGSGVRLMSCQVFGDKEGNFPAAIKYGADNGAVICQNSWGYGGMAIDIARSDKEAIDYFIKYAGCDNDGNQLPDSPMKGGVVIFAAGNDSWDVPAYPAAYPPVISVSAMAPDFKKAWYSNRGEWISIMAPGGDSYYTDGGVYSTVPNNQYEYMQGTSMACPHVSGIAALVVSKLGGKGFTNEDLKKHITSAVRQENIDEYNPEHKNRLGKGYIDAALTYATNENKAPAQIGEVSVNPDIQTLELTWNAVTDEDNGTAFLYNLYYTEKEKLDESNYGNYTPAIVRSGMAKAGDAFKHTVSDLSDDMEYHFAIVAEDRWGLKSTPAFFSARTKKNNAPVLTVTGPEAIRITCTEIAEVKISASDPDGHTWTYKINGETRGVSHKRVGDDIIVIFRAVAPAGKYSLTVSVADALNLTTTKQIDFETYANAPLAQVKAFRKLYVPVTKQDYSITLSEYFTNPDGGEIAYTVKSNNPPVAGAELSGDVLTIAPAATGIASLSVTASNKHNNKVCATIDVHVVKDELVHLVYPVPVNTVLNVRLSDAVQKATLTVRNATGGKVLERRVDTGSDELRLVQLDLSKLSGGTYTLHVESEGRTFRKTFVKH